MPYRVYYEHDGRYYKEYESLKEFCLERANYQCEECGLSDNLHVHHIKPKSDGGSNRPGNLIVLCSRCHGDQHNKFTCVYCSNLVSVNPHNGRPYWMERGTTSAVCYNCKDEPHIRVDYNVPDEATDSYY